MYKHEASAISTFNTYNACFGHVRIHMFGSLAPSCEYAYLVTCSYRLTRWPTAIWISTVAAELWAPHFVKRGMATHGCLSNIKTDRRQQIESNYSFPLLIYWASGGYAQPPTICCKRFSGPLRPLSQGGPRVSGARRYWWFYRASLLAERHI